MPTRPSASTESTRLSTLLTAAYVFALFLLGACGVRPAPASTSGGVRPAPASTTALTETDQAVCRNRPDRFGPFLLDEMQALQRYGIDAKTFADAPTTKERAIEVCGVTASRQWLRDATCADRSNAQQRERIGSVGPGGRCGAIIDLYTVICPERAHDVYMDIYMCGPGESPR